MKKILLIVFAAILAVSNVNAQVKIQSPHPDLSFKVSRCSCAGGVAVVDMVVTNYGSDLKTGFIASFEYTSAIDDEGNMYTGKEKRILFTVGDTKLKDFCAATLPQEIPLKFRVQISGIDPNASGLALLNISLSAPDIGLTPKNPVQVKGLTWSK